MAKLESQIPIIALNYLNNKNIINKNIIQFGLASEDEAEQLAFEAIQNGHKNAIILQTNFDWPIEPVTHSKVDGISLVAR